MMMFISIDVSSARLGRVLCSMLARVDVVRFDARDGRGVAPTLEKPWAMHHLMRPTEIAYHKDSAYTCELKTCCLPSMQTRSPFACAFVGSKRVGDPPATPIRDDRR
jgi:hypothetical protein